MIKIREIEEVISKLPPQKLAKFRTWYERFDAVRWDKQFEGDVKMGKLDATANRALKDFKKGNFKEL